MDIQLAVNTNLIWLIGVIVFMILEAATYQLVSVWFAFGAIGGLIASVLGGGFYTQAIVFIVISALCLIILRPLSIKLMKNQNIKTNTDSLIGKMVLITEEVDNNAGKGQGKINGSVWSVRSADGSDIPVGESVKIIKIEGVKLIVEKEE